MIDSETNFEGSNGLIQKGKNSLQWKLRDVEYADFDNPRRQEWSEGKGKGPVLAIRHLTEGGHIGYRKVTDLETLSGILVKIGSRNVTEVQEKGNLVAVDWTMTTKKSGLFGGGEDVPTEPRTIRFCKTNNNNLKYSVLLNYEGFMSGEDGNFSNQLGWSDELSKRFSPVRATNLFLHVFATDNYEPLVQLDVFGFQFFTGMETVDKDVRVRIAGIAFKFIPEKKPNSVLEGKVEISIPQNT